MKINTTTAMEVSWLLFLFAIFFFGLYWIDISTSAEIMQAQGIQMQAQSLFLGYNNFTLTYHLGILMVLSSFLFAVAWLINLKWAKIGGRK